MTEKLNHPFIKKDNHDYVDYYLVVPHCQTRLGVIEDFHKPNFCSNCGKALKWKEVDND